MFGFPCQYYNFPHAQSSFRLFSNYELLLLGIYVQGCGSSHIKMFGHACVFHVFILTSLSCPVSLLSDFIQVGHTN